MSQVEKENEKDDAEKPVIARTPYDLQRLKLEKLMKNFVSISHIAIILEEHLIEVMLFYFLYILSFMLIRTFRTNLHRYLKDLKKRIHLMFRILCEM